MQPSDFIPLIEKAESVVAVEHIYGCADHLFGFEYSPPVASDDEWVRLERAKYFRLAELDG